MFLGLQNFHNRLIVESWNRVDLYIAFEQLIQAQVSQLSDLTLCNSMGTSSGVATKWMLRMHSKAAGIMEGAKRAYQIGSFSIKSINPRK